MMKFQLDPDAKLDYKYGWGSPHQGRDAWLEDDETITDHTITPTAGITVDSSDIINDGRDVVVWVSGATNKTFQRVTCHVVTSAGREEDRTIRFEVTDR